MRNFGYSPMYYHSSFWPEGLISLLLNVLIWGIIVYFVVYLIRRMSADGQRGCCGMGHGHEFSNVKDDSIYLDIIKTRYAKGEINKKEFDELKKDLSEESEEQSDTSET